MALQPSLRRSILLLLVLVTLAFGWRPFRIWTENDVRHRPDKSALGFNAQYEAGDSAVRGVAYLAQDLDTRNWPGVTFRILLQGRSNGGGLGVFLEFFEEEGDGLPALLVSQWQNHLAMRSARDRSVVDRGYSEIGHRDLFAGTDFVELLVSSEGKKTHVYVDGDIVESRSDFSLLGPDNKFVGRVAIGNSADGSRPFTGEIRSLEIYDAFYRAKSASLAVATPVVSLDLSSATLPDGIRVPETFEPAKRTILHSVNNFDLDKPSTRSDIVVNSLGFIPVGLCFAAIARRRVKSFVSVLICVGVASFCLSLSIEWAQGYMVHRDSSQLDVLLNTLSGCSAVLVPRRWILFL